MPPLPLPLLLETEKFYTQDFWTAFNRCDRISLDMGRVADSWSKAGRPGAVCRIARMRTRGLLKYPILLNTTIEILLSSAYLQGLEDAFTVLYELNPDIKLNAPSALQGPSVSDKALSKD